MENIKFNDFVHYDNRAYYNWINENFKEYSFPEENYNSENYSEENAYDKLCGNVVYSLRPQQQFAAKVFNTEVTNNSMLVYHGLGSGKTQTSIVIGEAFKFRDINGKIIPGRTESKVIIAVPAALNEQYYNEIIGRFENGQIRSAPGEVIINGNRQYYIDEFIKRNLLLNYQSIEKLKQEISETEDIPKRLKLNNEILKLQNNIKNLKKDEESRVNRSYEIINHETFLNKLFVIKEGVFVEGPYLQYLKQPNGLLIIDEIQNLISESGTNYRRLLYALKYHAVPSFRVVLLTATPIYDKPFEIGLLMNLLRTRLVFPDGQKEFNELFLDDGHINNVNLFKKMCSGYISYFKGGNPVAYPYKKTTVMYHEMEQYQYDEYKKVFLKEVQRDIKSTLNNEEAFVVPKINDNNKENISSGIFNNSNLISNIAFPPINMTRSSKNFMKNSLQQFRKELENVVKEKRNVLEKVREYSSKFAKIAELVKSSEGTVFIYSNYVTYGVDALATVMDFVGYAEYPRKGFLGSYFIWKGGLKDQDTEKANNIFNSYANRNGELLKIMFGTQTVMEGVDFKNVRQVHILDPWWNDSRLQQIIGRGIRFCSHKDLPPAKRIVDVFIHLSSLNFSDKVYSVKVKVENEISNVYTDQNVENQNITKFNAISIKVNKDNITSETYDIKKEFKRSQIVTYSKVDATLSKTIHGWKRLDELSVQQYMYERSTRKLNLNRQFEKAMKEVAIDCSINKNGNVVRLDEKYTPYYQFYKLEYENYTTGELFTRSGVRSLSNPELPENVLTLQDILNNVAKNSTNYNFKSKLTDKKIKNKHLIVPEDIPCTIVDYNLTLPKKIITLTLSNQLIPFLKKMGTQAIYKYFSSVINQTIKPHDPKLSNNIKRFMSKGYLQEKQKYINLLKERDYTADDDVWDLFTLEELKKEYFANLS
jgi:superfamily II DNA or RNA helicase